MQRVWMDSSTHEDAAPDWTRGLSPIWEKGDKVWVHTQQTVRGDERVNGCMDLARLDAREILLTEIASDVRGSIDSAQQTLSENAELVLGKVRTGEFRGRITGLRHTEEYFERYRIANAERIDCHVLSEITAEEFAKLKRNVGEEIRKIDARVRDAVSRKQAEFFLPE